MLRRRRMMQKFRGIAFHDSIDIVYTKLALIHEEPISWRFTFEKRYGPFDSPNPAEERSDQQRDNTEMRDEKREVRLCFNSRKLSESTAEFFCARGSGLG